MGIEVVVDLPGVGANLHDHPVSSLTSSAGRPVPTFSVNPPGEALGLLRTDPRLDAPDLQIIFASVPVHPPTLSGPSNGYSIAVSAMAPRSRGSVRLAVSNATTAPLVDPNYLTDEWDVATMTAGLRIAWEIGRAESLAPWRGEEVLPGPDVEDAEAICDYLRRSLLPYFHYAGTCRIGNDETAVVDPELRVRGIAGLRVADASVMPSIVSANTNATVYAIAEKADALLAA